MPDEMLEKMRLLAFEIENYGFSCVGTANGAFGVRRKGSVIRIIASDAEGWEHVSVSTPTRCPTWEEMDFVKGLFWRDEEAVMQLHPPREQWVNNHPHCLHLWRPKDTTIPLPPAIFVGIKSAGVMRNEADARRIRDEAIARGELLA